MRMLMLFLDGVGIGSDNPDVNPFFRADVPALRSLCGGEAPSLNRQHHQDDRSTLLPLDANLGVEGLPQSGTGQTALFTGMNAPEYIHKHFGPYPYSTLRPIVQEKNIFRQMLDAGKSVYFANGYPQKFFDYFKEKQTRLTVTTLSCKYSNIPLHTGAEIQQGTAISADITNAAWPRMGYPAMPLISAGEAGRRLAKLSLLHDFVLFEYWRTDKAGHAENMAEAVESIEMLDRMLQGILESMNLNETLLILTSDHGNIEDMSTKVHTRNPVPAILAGYRHNEVAQELGQRPDLTNVTPTLVRSIIAA